MSGCTFCGWEYQAVIEHRGRRCCLHCAGVIAEKRDASLASMPQLPWYSRALAWFAGAKWGL